MPTEDELLRSTRTRAEQAILDRPPSRGGNLATGDALRANPPPQGDVRLANPPQTIESVRRQASRTPACSISAMRPSLLRGSPRSQTR